LFAGHKAVLAGIGFEILLQEQQADADYIFSVIQSLFLLVCRFGYYSTQEEKEKEQLP
jgi:hypothetical protein